MKLKMKLIKVHTAIIALLLAALGFSSCGKDGEDDGGGPKPMYGVLQAQFVENESNAENAIIPDNAQNDSN